MPQAIRDLHTLRLSARQPLLLHVTMISMQGSCNSRHPPASAPDLCEAGDKDDSQPMARSHGVISVPGVTVPGEASDEEPGPLAASDARRGGGPGPGPEARKLARNFQLIMIMMRRSVTEAEPRSHMAPDETSAAKRRRGGEEKSLREEESLKGA